MKKQRLLGRRELRDFCYQFGIENPKLTPRKLKGYKQKSYPKKDKKGKSKYHKNHIKKFKNKSKTRKDDKKVLVCFKCNKRGHYANKCFDRNTKQKINELLLESKKFDKEEMETIINKLQIDSDKSEEESDNNSQCSCCDTESYESSDELNVLSTEERFILETIDTIKDPTEKIT